MHWRIAALLVVSRVLTACTTETENDNPRDGGIELPVPSPGVQLETVGLTIPSGSDQEWCEVVQIPGSPQQEFLVGGIEIAMTPFSHHLIVSMAPEGSASLSNAALGQPRRCSGAHSYGDDLLTFAVAAQPHYRGSFPEGVGQRIRGGDKLVFDYHYLNSSPEPAPAKHVMNLYFAAHIDKPARVFGFYNQYIDIPPHSRRSFVEECRFKNDVLVWSLFRHTHRRGTDFDVSWAGGERDGDVIWKSTSWDEAITFTFDKPSAVRAGTGFRWHCAFDNPTDEHVTFGPEATDEMCILFGQFAALGPDAETGPQSCYRFAPLTP